jgi:hypothetical protein
LLQIDGQAGPVGFLGLHAGELFVVGLVESQTSVSPHVPIIGTAPAPVHFLYPLPDKQVTPEAWHTSIAGVSVVAGTQRRLSDTHRSFGVQVLVAGVTNSLIQYTEVLPSHLYPRGRQDPGVGEGAVVVTTVVGSAPPQQNPVVQTPEAADLPILLHICDSQVPWH